MTSHYAPADIRTVVRDGRVVNEFTARCREPGCGWVGTERADLATASAEGLAHQNWVGT